MIGRNLGHYEITEPLGAGGMGEVCRARDTKLERGVTGSNRIQVFGGPSAQPVVPLLNLQ